MSIAMTASFQYVPLTDIALDDQTFIVTYQPEMHALQRSVARAGVLTPLHLRRLPDQGLLQVVCGSKRLRACQQAGYTTVPALVHSAAELTDEQAFLLALHDNLGCRMLNAVEKARILCRLRDHFGYPAATLIEVFCPLLDLPPRAETLRTYGALAALDDAIQAAVVDGTLPLDTAVWIGQHPHADRQGRTWTPRSRLRYGGLPDDGWTARRSASTSRRCLCAQVAALASPTTGSPTAALSAPGPAQLVLPAGLAVRR